MCQLTFSSNITKTKILYFKVRCRFKKGSIRLSQSIHLTSIKLYLKMLDIELILILPWILAGFDCADPKYGCSFKMFSRDKAQNGGRQKCKRALRNNAGFRRETAPNRALLNKGTREILTPPTKVERTKAVCHPSAGPSKHLYILSRNSSTEPGTIG